MKRFLMFAVVLVMTVSMLSGCATVNKVQLGVMEGQGQNVQATLGTVMPDVQPDNQGGNIEDDPNTLPPEDNNGGNADDTPAPDNNGGNTDDTPAPDNNGGNTDDTPAPDNTNPGTEGEGENEGEGEGESEEEPEEIDPNDESSGYHKILSYNLKAMYYDVFTAGTMDQREGVAKYIKEHNPALVGLQEIDCNNPRSFSYDQMKYLADQTGYYYYFCDAMNYEDKGYQYGTGILSKYPIKDVKKVYYQVQDPRTDEKRAYSRAVIEFPEGDLVFYNTHLCTASAEDPTKEAGQQFNEVLRAVYNEKLPAILTADYNLLYEVRSQMIDTNKVTQLNGGADLCFFDDDLPIDDIYVRNLEYYANPNTQMSIFKDEHDVAPWSDHIPCWGYFKFKGSR